MTGSPRGIDDQLLMRRALEAIIRIGVVAVLAFWCFLIVRPFLIPLVWGIIIAVASYPLYRRIAAWVGGRPAVAAALFTLIALVVLVVPMVLLTGTLVDTAQVLAQDLSDGALTIPPPPESVAGWPVIGEPVAEFWKLATVNLAAALGQIGPQLKAAGLWLLSGAAGAGLAIAQFVFAIFIAGVLLAHAGGGGKLARSIATRLAGRRGEEFAELAQATVRSVSRGIIGVALIQAVFAGLGFLAVGIPAAGLLALICLLLAVIQIGVFPVLIPVVIYVFATADPLIAGAFAVWCLLVGLLDNILKPILLGRGVKVPMLIVFVGAIGGFLASGIIGLFVGPVILALGYVLFLAWLNAPAEPVAER